jgi:hypothetical protein
MRGKSIKDLSAGLSAPSPDGAYLLFCGILGTLRAWSVEAGSTFETGAPASYDLLVY